jgi:outer membrane protein OmpA-like peptidoglycan-associated protein
MSKSEPRLGRSAMLAAAIFFTIQGFAAAQQPSAASIVKALSAPVTRSLSAAPSVAPEHVAEEQFVNGLRGRTRSLSVSEVSKLDAIVATRRDVDFEMRFGLNSAELRGKDREVVAALGEALGSAEFKTSTFLIMGHTDARGAAKANQKLSERRAEAVKRALVTEYGVAPERLVTVGYGQTHLKNESDPHASENRRVQVVNIMAFKAAEN